MSFSIEEFREHMNRIGDEEKAVKANQQKLRERIERMETTLQQYREELGAGDVKLQSLTREFEVRPPKLLADSRELTITAEPGQQYPRWYYSYR